MTKILIDRAVVEQALEALYEETAWFGPTPKGAAAIPALRAALAEPVQEPVAWMVYTEGGTSAYVTDNPNDLVGAYRALALYTAPPQRKPLTDEEIRDLWSWAMTAEAERTATTQQHAFARAIERAHGIGEP